MLHPHHPNIVSFQLESGIWKWYILGCYLDPDETLTIYSVLSAIIQRSRGVTLLVAVNFNADMNMLYVHARDEDIAAALDGVGLEDMSSHFLPRLKSWD